MADPAVPATPTTPVATDPAAPAAVAAAPAAPVADPAAPVADPAPVVDPNAAPNTILQEAVKPAEVKDVKNDETREGAPAEFEDFTFKDGVEIDDGMLGQYKDLAKDLDLSQSNAQKLVDLYANKMDEFVQAQTQAFADLKEEWANAARTDEEIGGEKFNDNVHLAKSAIDVLGTPELREALNVTGVGDHPEIIRFFAKVGKAISEDKVLFGNLAKGAQRTPEEILFPDQN